MDDTRASRQLLQAALRSGDERARLPLAGMLLDGRDGPIDPDGAIEVLEPAEPGNAIARRMLTTAMALRPGGFPDAVRRRLEHARAGDRDAAVQMGVLLLDSHPAQSLELLQGAARQGAGLAAAALLHHAKNHEGLWPELEDWLNALMSAGYPLAGPLKTAMANMARTSHAPVLPADTDGLEHLDPASRAAKASPAQLGETPRIQSHSAAVGHALCDYLLAAAWPTLRRAEVFDPVTGRSSQDAHRKAYSASIPRSFQDLVVARIVADMAACTGTTTAFAENLAILLYYPGDEYKPHLDCFTSDEGWAGAELTAQGQRRATTLAALNSGYEGGETRFPRLDLSWRGEKGDMLSFENVTRDGTPDPLSLHQGLPVTAGWKALASLWVREQAPGAAGIAERTS
ncbi:2OG-Fe(II) oxygenase [Glycocaulis abyssi]|uniref:2OG-Fe(II) oxygenase n=1 Tax=Glycocaulis abyssi TaxID=1433403 RepID=A0ABV9NEL4_9PROT